MASEKKKIEKKVQAKPQKGKAFVDTTTSKVVKGSNKAELEKDDKVVVENIESHEDNVRTASTLEEFLTDLAGYRDRLHDFAVDSYQRSLATKELYEMITGKTIEPKFDEDGEEEEIHFEWDEFGKYWDEIEEAAKNISPETMNKVIDIYKYDLDGEYTGESLEQDLMNAINEALSNKTMKASDVNAWLKENDLKDVVSKLKAEDGKYNVDDIIKLISDKERKELQSDVVTTMNLDEGVATEDDIDIEDENEDGKEEKDSSNPPEVSDLTNENIVDDVINEDIDLLDEFREMAKTSESLEAFINAIRTKNDVPTEVSTAFFNKYGQDGKSPEQAAETLYNEVKGSMNENIHQDMKRLIQLMALKESANELVNKFGLTNIDSIKESLVEELSDDEYKIVLEDVYKALNIEVENDFTDKTELLNESLRSDLHDKLL